MPYQFLANAVLALHIAIVLFVVAGLIVIVIGNWRRWRWLRWINAFWFRLLHLATIGIVVAESWLGFACPLTTLEMWLRNQAGAATYAGGFIEHWMQSILYWQLPPWVFVIAYSLFGVAVAATWWLYPPRRA